MKCASWEVFWEIYWKNNLSAVKNMFKDIQNHFKGTFFDSTWLDNSTVLNEINGLHTVQQHQHYCIEMHDIDGIMQLEKKHYSLHIQYKMNQLLETGDRFWGIVVCISGWLLRWTLSYSHFWVQFCIIKFWKLGSNSNFVW